MGIQRKDTLPQYARRRGAKTIRHDEKRGERKMRANVEGGGWGNTRPGATRPCGGGAEEVAYYTYEYELSGGAWPDRIGT